MTIPFEVGDHILYIPPHADGNAHHEDCEIGFVTGIGRSAVYCKFFYPGGCLRTRSNSEACDPKSLKKLSNVKMHLKEVDNVD